MPDLLPVNRHVAIPLDEIVVRASRSSGPGGQHANVTSSRIEASFDVAASNTLDEAQKARHHRPLRAGRPRRRAGRPQPVAQPRARARAPRRADRPRRSRSSARGGRRSRRAPRARAGWTPSGAPRSARAPGGRPSGRRLRRLASAGREAAALRAGTASLTGVSWWGRQPLGRGRRVGGWTEGLGALCMHHMNKATRPAVATSFDRGLVELCPAEGHKSPRPRRTRHKPPTHTRHTLSDDVRRRRHPASATREAHQPPPRRPLTCSRRATGDGQDAGRARSDAADRRDRRLRGRVPARSR